MLRMKEGVSIAGIRPELSVGLSIADGVFAKRGRDCVVTSGVEGEHMKGSKHYVGLAADLRKRHLPGGMDAEVVVELRRDLGADFDVVLKPTHIHIEFDPKAGPSG